MVDILAGLLAAGLLGLLALLAFAPRASTSGGYGNSYGQRQGDEFEYYDDFGYKRRSGAEMVDGKLECAHFGHHLTKPS